MIDNTPIIEGPVSSISSCQATAQVRNHEFHRGEAFLNPTTQEGPDAVIFICNSYSSPFVNCIEGTGLITVDCTKIAQDNA